MNPERFDELTRLWVMAPSRRSFLLQVGAVFAYGALGRVGIRIPRWLGPTHDTQCLPGFRYREGMPCGGPKEKVKSCGICQNGRCIPVDSVCQGRDKCGRCDPATATCEAECPKGQTCCKDGCCDGTCTADDGACCPRDKQCGKNKELCCRECGECGPDNTCRKPAPPKECPEKTHRLVDGCCVCRTTLCAGRCCDAPCLEGKCCEECGLDKAACCDGRKCCRERCMDPAEAEKCCECWEDISEEEAKAVLERTRKWAKYQQDNKIPYLQDESADPNDPAPKTMDCSYFVQKALGIELLRSMYEHKPKPERLSTRLLDGNCYFKRVKPEDTRAGDLVAQPRNSGPPGSQHVGTATGAPGAKGGHQGIAMGNGKNNAGSTGVSTWGVPRGPEGGSFDNADQLRVYRPQKRKKGCTDK